MAAASRHAGGSGAGLSEPALVVGEPSKHPSWETRQFALGRTDQGRELTIVFTLRGSLLRVISARPMSRKERRVYAQSQEV
ncbi:MAG: BrnT family toxin [Bryobacteraceae bacterium]|nr:BrnT family toxin [Bryobacteraceae bacterium]